LLLSYARTSYGGGLRLAKATDRLSVVGVRYDTASFYFLAGGPGTPNWLY